MRVDIVSGTDSHQRWRAAGSVCLVIVLFATVFATAAEARPRFQGAALGNSSQGDRIPKHRFVVGDGYSLRLRDHHGQRTRFSVCLTKGQAKLKCQGGRTGPRSTKGWSSGFTFAVAPGQTGRYVYRWYVAGSQVAAWRVDIGVGD